MVLCISKRFGYEQMHSFCLDSVHGGCDEFIIVLRPCANEPKDSEVMDQSLKLTADLLELGR